MVTTQSRFSRIFCAIDFAENVRLQLQSHVRQLREAVQENRASWNRPENIHLTVKFFGEVEQNQIPKISTAATRAVARSSTFHIRLSGTGVFPAHGAPRVLWIGIEDPSNLTGLHSRFEEECALQGFAEEVRPFHPHLTIARLRKPEGSRALAEFHKSLSFNAVEVAVSEMVVS